MYASFLLGRLLREAESVGLLDDVALDWRRVRDEVLDNDTFSNEQGSEPDDEPVATSRVIGDGLPRLELTEFDAVYFAAFRGPDDERDVYYLLKSSIVAAYHGALRQLFKKISSFDGEGRLPERIRDWLRPRTGDLLPQAWEDLLLLDVSRRCLVHNWGRVDRDFVLALRNPPVQEGEVLPLSEYHLHRYALGTRSLASQLWAASYK